MTVKESVVEGTCLWCFKVYNDRASAAACDKRHEREFYAQRAKLNCPYKAQR